MKRKILWYGNPLLRRKTEPVEVFGGELRALVEDLFETMVEGEGVGLAAPQVGVPLRVFVGEIPQLETGRVVLVNPEIVASEGVEMGEEGCLSFPDIAGEVERAARITVRSRDLDGGETEREYRGYVARMVQHEMDHLDGVLFIDRMSPLRRSLLRGKLKRLRKRQAERGL